MNPNTDNNESDFNSPDEAFEYLINQRMEEKRKKEWTEAFNKVESASKSNLPKTKAFRILYFRIASAAAVLAILACAFWVTKDLKGNDITMAQNYINQTNVNLSYNIDTRNLEIENTTSELSEIIEERLSKALLRKDFNQMLEIYRSVKKKAELSTKDKFYYATCLLKNEKEDKYEAIKFLDDVIANDKYLEIEALYLRGLAKIEIGDASEAEADLKSILSKSNYKSEIIKSILEQKKQ